jgi:hypothetical protein
MTSNMLIFSNEDDLNQDTIKELKHKRSLRQHTFYMARGAEAFYTYRGTDLRRIRWQEETAFFQKQPFWTDEDSLSFISLGCGNGEPEKQTLFHLAGVGSQIDYFGVDTSRKMLQMAQAGWKNAPLNVTWILADFSRPDFAARLSGQLAGKGARLYAMFGGTFGNFRQKFIARTLGRIMRSGDYLYLDVVPIESDPGRLSGLRGRFARLPENYALFFSHLLSLLSIHPEAGMIKTTEIHEKFPESICYTFSFLFQIQSSILYAGRRIPVNSGDRIDLLSIRAYNTASLQTFLEEWGHRMIDTFNPHAGNLPHRWSRILFQRRN